MNNLTALLDKLKEESREKHELEEAKKNAVLEATEKALKAAKIKSTKQKGIVYVPGGTFKLP